MTTVMTRRVVATFPLTLKMRMSIKLIMTSAVAHIAEHLLPAPEAVGTLGELAVGSRARVQAVVEAGAIGERLMEMGLTPGTEVEVVRRGLLGRTLQLRLRGYMLSLHATQARNIAITPYPGC